MMTGTCFQCGTCEHQAQSIFCSLSAPQLDSLKIQKVVNTYRPHQIIFYAGNPPQGIYCIRSGKIKSYSLDTDGRQQIVRISGPGEPLGYGSLLSDEPYAATAETLEESAICFIEKQSFMRLLETYPKIGLRLMQILAVDLQNAHRTMSTLAYKSVRERLAELLLLLHARYGRKTSEGIRLDISLTRREMAEIIGATQESVIRLVSEFRQKGYLQVDGHTIILRDLPHLVDTAHISA